MKKEFCFCFLSFFLFHLFSFCSTTTTTTKQQRPVQRLSLGRRRPESRRTRGFGFGRTSRLCQQRSLVVAFVVVVDDVGMLLSGRRVCTCFGRKEPVSDEQQRAPLFFVRDKCNSVGPESTSAAAAAAAAAARRRRRRPGRSRLGPRCLLRRGFPLPLVR